MLLGSMNQKHKVQQPKRLSDRTGLRGWLSGFTDQPDEDSKNRALVFACIFLGTLALFIIVTSLLFLSYAVLGNGYVGPRLLVAGLSTLFLFGIGAVARKYKIYQVAAWVLITFYSAVAITILVQWGINLPFGIVLMGLVIIVSGILIRARYALYAATFMSAALTTMQILIREGVYTPNTTWTNQPSSFGDVLGYSTVFMMIAVISWLYGSQMERSLRKATAAEEALQIQNANLEQIVKQRTADLEQTRREEMAQMYRFAQFGSLSTGLFHDLANYLTVLSLDIQNLNTKHRSSTLDRAQETLQYIDDMIDDVRDQIKGNVRPTTFNLAQAIDKVVQVLQHKAEQSGVQLTWHKPMPTTSFSITGDSAHVNQILTTFICNAIESYDKHAKHNEVQVRLELIDQHFIISIRDTGKGISEESRAKLFKPFRTTKKQGMGIGLFIAKQMIESEYNGSITLDPSFDQTLFVIRIPIKK